MNNKIWRIQRMKKKTFDPYRTHFLDQIQVLYWQFVSVMNYLVIDIIRILGIGLELWKLKFQISVSFSFCIRECEYVYEPGSWGRYKTQGRPLIDEYLINLRRIFGEERPPANKPKNFLKSKTRALASRQLCRCSTQADTAKLALTYTVAPDKR